MEPKQVWLSTKGINTIGNAAALIVIEGALTFTGTVNL